MLTALENFIVLESMKQPKQNNKTDPSPPGLAPDKTDALTVIAGRSEEELVARVPKSLLVALLGGAAFVFCALLFLIWALPHYGLGAVSSTASQVIMATVISLGAFFLLFCVCLLLALLFSFNIPFLQHMRGVVNRVLYPVMRFIGFVFRLPKSKVRLAFIRLNNELVRSGQIKCKPQELLVLLPHCIQKSDCPYRLTHNIQNCARCGACAVGPLLNLADKYGVQIIIVPGGTVARQRVRELKPKCLVAVACHRDLSSGVRDVAALPVYGVVNQRPFGPCINTTVDVKEVEKAVCSFLGIKTAD